MDGLDRVFACLICLFISLAHLDVTVQIEANALLIEQLTYEQCGKSNHD